MANPGFSKKIETKIYKEQILEDFEKSKYDNKKHLSYQVHDNNAKRPSIKIRNQFPAPTKGSKNYLGIKFYAKWGDFLNVTPVKPLKVYKYCKEFYVWVYGKNYAGELSFVIQDSDKNIHRLVMGRLNFLGWRKLKVKVRNHIKQEEDLLNKKKFIQIIRIQYRAANRTRLPIWHYFYIDNISVSVRDKYTDKQSDDW